MVRPTILVTPLYKNPVTVHDFQATILILLGIDRQRLTRASN